MTRTKTALMSLALLTASLALPLALATGPNMDAGPSLVDPSVQDPLPTLPGPGILLYDDGPYSASQQAAENLALPHTFTDDPCELAQATDDQSYHLIVVNSIGAILSACDEEIFTKLADFASGPGTLIVQSWELDLCGDDSSVPWEVPCSAASVDALLASLGAARPFTTHFDPVTLAATTTVTACGPVPNPFLPTVDRIEPQSTGFIRNAQGVQADGATPCFTAEETGEGQVLAHENGAYVGVHPTNYEEGRTTTLPGPADIVKLYEDLLVRYA